MGHASVLIIGSSRRHNWASFVSVLIIGSRRHNWGMIGEKGGLVEWTTVAVLQPRDCECYNPATHSRARLAGRAVTSDTSPRAVFLNFARLYLS